ncbi:unnamed protein product [Peronospora belbahrii]|uniref:Uncharacterized protein n=1 Tax=Peronospora belbahrii TaxID=622444 RepID=A0ABN8CQB8_9STRA|nr:unnamed protein product [Peronospora belbahrii]
MAAITQYCCVDTLSTRPTSAFVTPRKSNQYALPAQGSLQDGTEATAEDRGLNDITKFATRIVNSRRFGEDLAAVKNVAGAESLALKLQKALAKVWADKEGMNEKQAVELLEFDKLQPDETNKSLLNHPLFSMLIEFLKQKYQDNNDFEAAMAKAFTYLNESTLEKMLEAARNTNSIEVEHEVEIAFLENHSNTMTANEAFVFLRLDAPNESSLLDTKQFNLWDNFVKEKHSDSADKEVVKILVEHRKELATVNILQLARQNKNTATRADVLQEAQMKTWMEREDPPTVEKVYGDFSRYKDLFGFGYAQPMFYARIKFARMTNNYNEETAMTEVLAVLRSKKGKGEASSVLPLLDQLTGNAEADKIAAGEVVENKGVTEDGAFSLLNLDEKSDLNKPTLDYFDKGEVTKLQKDSRRSDRDLDGSLVERPLFYPWYSYVKYLRGNEADEAIAFFLAKRYDNNIYTLLRMLENYKTYWPTSEVATELQRAQISYFVRQGETIQSMMNTLQLNRHVLKILAFDSVEHKIIIAFVNALQSNAKKEVKGENEAIAYAFEKIYKTAEELDQLIKPLEDAKDGRMSMYKGANSNPWSKDIEAEHAEELLKWIKKFRDQRAKLAPGP